MNETISAGEAQHRAFAKPAAADLSRVPAYVDPPLPSQPRTDHAPQGAALALTGTAFGTVLLLGWSVYASGPAEPVIASMPPRPLPVQASVPPRDVPLPSGLHYVATAVTQPPAVVPGRVGHPTRLTRPSRG